jgi:dGTPase
MNKLIDGEKLWEKFDKDLAPYAQKNITSLGREFKEPVDIWRLPFQRDADRIIHSRAFRRLRGKMQVTNPMLNDHFRNRLSHTLEVAQVSRSLSRILNLNEDLVEAIALAHDLGHPPFGHSGEFALHQKLKKYKLSFDHNKHGLKILTKLEKKNSTYDGLNLTIETLQGVQKHENKFSQENKTIFSPHLECQLVDVADEIAYISADIDDGLSGKFFDIEELNSIIKIPNISNKPVSKAVMKYFLEKIINDTNHNLKLFKVENIRNVQENKEKIITFSRENKKDFFAIKKFLNEKYYQAKSIKEATNKGEKVVNDLFDLFFNNNDFLPETLFNEKNRAEKIADYIAGMTDNFAINLWQEKTNK